MSLETSIREIRETALAESTEYFEKIEQLVRLGLMPIQYLPLIKRAFVHIKTDMMLPMPERQAFYEFVIQILDITLGDPTIDRLLRQRVAAHHMNMSASRDKHLSVKLGEGIDLKGTPEGTLIAYANAVKNKIRAGGKPTTNDKQMATQAKNELRRRRNVAAKRGSGPIVGESLTYAEKLQLAFEEFGIGSLSELDLKNKTAFFDYIDNITPAGSSQ